MGIDIYLRWPNQTKEEEEAQYTGFSIEAGHVGYLREAYHGAPYATRVLVPEAFDSENGTAEIKASLLRERLPAVEAAARERESKVYNEGRPLDGDPRSLKAFRDFVELAERMEAKHGKVTVLASY